MNGLMKKYKESLENMSEPILLSDCKHVKMDLSGLMKYAKSKGMKVADLSSEEKAKFIYD